MRTAFVCPARLIQPGTIWLAFLRRGYGYRHCLLVGTSSVVLRSDSLAGHLFTNTGAEAHCADKHKTARVLTERQSGLSARDDSERVDAESSARAENLFSLHNRRC